MTGQDAFAAARRKSRNGSYIVWKNKAGEFLHAPRNPKNLKRAMLAVGTAGRFTEISSPTAAGFVVNWGIAVIMRRNYRYGC